MTMGVGLALGRPEGLILNLTLLLCSSFT